MDYNRQKTDDKKEDGNTSHPHLYTLPQRRAVFLDNGVPPLQRHELSLSTYPDTRHANGF